MDGTRAGGGAVRASRGSDRGVALVEFAIIMPLLFLLVFGIIEFGNAFFQNLDVRHGAREGARLAAVNAFEGEADQVSSIIAETCARMDMSGGSTVVVSIDVNGSLVAPPSDAGVGDEVTVTVQRDLDQLTGFLAFALDGVDLTSSVTTRLEQPATYVDGSSPC